MAKMLDPRYKAALEKLAFGYDYEEKDVTADKTGKPVQVHVRSRHVPPDIRAIEKIEYYRTLGVWPE